MLQQSLTSTDPALAQLAASPAHIARLQMAILSALALTYQQVSAAVVTKALNIDSVAAVAGLDAKKDVVEKVDGETVYFVGTSDNSKRQRVFQEGVSFAAISSLMTKISQ